MSFSSADEYLDMSRFILPGGLQQLQQEDVSFLAPTCTALHYVAGRLSV